MKLHCRPAAACLAGLLLTTCAIAAAVPATAAAIPDHQAAMPVAGTGHAVAHSITVRAAVAAARLASSAKAGAVPTMLGRDGKPTGSTLTANPATGSRPKPSSPATQSGRPNGPQLVGGSLLSLRTATATHAATSMVTGTTAAPAASPAIGIRGVTQGNTGCSTCTTPDVTAALNATQIAEAVNLQLQVYNKSGTSLCGVGLSSLLGAYTALSGPRIQYDANKKRFSLLIDSVPSSSGDVAIQYLATSQGDDACGAWWVYSIVFPISTTYPLGALLDYPYLGQDSVSILSSTNNFSFGGSYLGSAAYAMPKAIAYTGAAFNITTYPVAFSTAPVTVGSLSVPATASTYWLAAVPGTGYDLYTMPTSPAGAITLKSVVHASFSAPSRRVAQPGTSQTLDPGDGRIGSAAVQDPNYVWFAHDIDDGGLPTVQYGAISIPSGQAFTALAYHGGSSYDFNPSIAVTPASGGTDYIWLNWAYTEPSAGVAASDTVAGVAAGDGVPDEVGNDLTVVTGSPTASNSTFGRYSSSSIDPSGTSSCPAGLTALTAQQFFTSAGLWTTQLARTTFC